jgi:flagellar biosynthesis GTPase FlhF
MLLLLMLFVAWCAAVGHIPIPRIPSLLSNRNTASGVCRACADAAPGSADWCDCCTNRCGSASRCESHAAVCAEMHAARLQLAEIERRENAAQRNAIFGTPPRAKSLVSPPRVSDVVTGTYRGRPGGAADNNAVEQREDASRLRARWSALSRPSSVESDDRANAAAQLPPARHVARVGAIRQRLRDDALRDSAAAAIDASNEQRRIDEALAARNQQLDSQQKLLDDARRASDAFIDAALQERKQRQMEEIAKARLAIEAQREAGEHEAKAAAAKLLASMELGARDVVKLGWYSSDTYLLQLFTPDCVVCPDHDRVLLLVSRALMRQPGLEIGRIDCAAAHALCSRIGVRVFSDAGGGGRRTRLLFAAREGRGSRRRDRVCHRSIQSAAVDGVAVGECQAAKHGPQRRF